MAFVTGVNLGFRFGQDSVLAAADQPRRIIQFAPKTEWSSGVVAAFGAATDTNPIPLHIVLGVHPAAATLSLPGNVEFGELTLVADLDTTLLLPLASDRNAVFAAAKVLSGPLGSAPFWVAFWDGAVLANRPANIQYNIWCARRGGT